MEAITGDLTKLDGRSDDDKVESFSNKLCEIDVSNKLTIDPNPCRFLCECALDCFYTRKYELHEYLNLVSLCEMNIDAEKTQTHNLHIIFKAYLPDDKTTQTFKIPILLRVRQSILIVFAYVGNDRLTLGNFLDFPTDHLTDFDYGSDREVSQLNPAFSKVISKGKSLDKSPERGPTYRPSPQRKNMHRRTCLYNGDPELIKEIKCFKTDVGNSGGFEVGYYPLMERAGIPGTWICKYYDIENKPLPAYSLTKLRRISQLALCF
ncbi:uncharacterized protein LOC141678591 [Apium graveolens]|uniref:uncharacterized protein LOC141678591 n=1 Tax=Apium graveolens TaxID=4045 RepID=UPI003D7AAFCE